MLVVSAGDVGDGYFEVYVIENTKGWRSLRVGTMDLKDGDVSEPSGPMLIKVGEFKKYSYSCRFQFLKVLNVLAVL